MLDGDSGNAWTNTREDFPWNRTRGVGVLIGCDRLIALCSQNDHLISGLYAGNSGHVDHRMVHTHAPYKWRTASANQQAEMIP